MQEAVAAGEKTAHGMGRLDYGGESVNDRNAAIKALEMAWNYLDVQNRKFKAVVLKCNGVYDGVTVFDETLDGIKDALALLKAQEPETAIVVQNGIDASGGWWYQCPNCKMEIEPRDNYCRTCGQAVKWE